VPAGGEQRRDSERELRLKARIGNELPIELGHPDLAPRFPALARAWALRGR
jgi:hypothetical protein